MRVGDVFAEVIERPGRTALVQRLHDAEPVFEVLARNEPERDLSPHPSGGDSSNDRPIGERQQRAAHLLGRLLDDLRSENVAHVRECKPLHVRRRVPRPIERSHGRRGHAHPEITVP